MRIERLAFDRSRVLAWWTGRLTNAELAEWTGQTERDVRLILDTPFMRGEIQGGGRGSKNTRRISRKARNAVAIVAALRKSGLSIEAAANLLNAVPVLASFPTETIDFSPNALEAHPAPYGNIVMLAIEQPDRGWLPTDKVPRHVFDRHCRPLVKADAPIEVGIGEIAWLPVWQEEMIEGLPSGWRSFGDPVYRPEIDPLGIYEFNNTSPDTHDAMDHHFYIVDGRWVWVRYHDPDPRQYAVDVFQTLELRQPRRFNCDEIEFRFSPIAELRQEERTAESMRGDEQKEAAARQAWEQFRTKLDVNASLAIREMKRAALGLTP
ncbi:hypothetical protein ATO13_01090 [Stappia sp. 22II-S9-Z10]|nr:hypothetical protein ATO13_01090 [Stappia sp. 22II-S9-Z10]